MTSNFLSIARQGKNDWLRYIASILLLFSIVFMAMVPILTGMILIASMTLNTLDDPQWINTLLYTNPFMGYGLVGLIGFAFIAGLYLAVTRVHERPFLTLISPDTSISWRRILQGLGLWLGLSLVSFVIQYIVSPESYDFTFNASEWIPFLFLAMLVTPIAATASVLFVFGYLCQGLGLIIRNPLILMLVFGLIIGGFAFDLREPGAVVFSILHAVFLLGIAIRDNRGELVLGMTIANSLISSLLLGIPVDTFTTMPLFILENPPSPWSAVVSLILRGGIFYLLLLRSHPRQPNLT